MAGLACGLHLQKAGVNFAILEASDGVGGRVRTDTVDGFLLDRGFQIFLTSYQEAQAVLDYPALNLKPFYAGTKCHYSRGSQGIGSVSAEDLLDAHSCLSCHR